MANAIKVIVTTLLIIAAIVAVATLCGCSSGSLGVRGKGMYANTSTGTIGAGWFKVSTTPHGEESAYVEYSEDTALLSPSTKTHYIEANLNGSNAVSQVGVIVTAICDAYISTKSAETNAVENVK